MEKQSPELQKRITLEIAVDDDHGEPLATMNLIAYPPAEEMHHFCSFPAHQGLGLRASAESYDLFPGTLLYNDEIEVIESEASQDDRMQRELQYTEKFIGNQDELLRRFIHYHYDLAFSSIRILLRKEQELHEVSRSREKYHGYDEEEVLRAFYIAQQCAPLCGQSFTISYKEVYRVLQEHWKMRYVEARQNLQNVVSEKSELIKKGSITLNFETMKHNAARIDGFDMSEYEELKKKFEAIRKGEI